jgi:hypothetical protein
MHHSLTKLRILLRKEIIYQFHSQEDERMSDEIRDLFGEIAPRQVERASLNTIQQRVFDLLQQNEAARNSDNILIYLYWRTYDSCVSLEDMVYATPPEDIRRCRQKLNERQLFLPTDPDIMRKRRRRQMSFTQFELNL